MLLIDDKVEVRGINEAIKAMRMVDKEAIAALRKELKGAITPTAKKIAAQVPTTAPLSGMNHSGRTRWTGARGTVSFAPARIRKGQDTHPIVSIVLVGAGKGAGFDIAEIAGSADLAFSKNKKKGRAFLLNLEGRAPWSFSAGRFGFGYFLREKKDLQVIAETILYRQAKEFNDKLRRAA